MDCMVWAIKTDISNPISMKFHSSVNPIQLFSLTLFQLLSVSEIKRQKKIQKGTSISIIENNNCNYSAHSTLLVWTIYIIYFILDDNLYFLCLRYSQKFEYFPSQLNTISLLSRERKKENPRFKAMEILWVFFFSSGKRTRKLGCQFLSHAFFQPYSLRHVLVAHIFKAQTLFFAMSAMRNNFVKTR